MDQEKVTKKSNNDHNPLSYPLYSQTPAGHTTTDCQCNSPCATGRRPRIPSLPTRQDGPGWPAGSLLRLHPNGTNMLNLPPQSRSTDHVCALHWSLHIEAQMSSSVNQCLEAFCTSTLSPRYPKPRARGGQRRGQNFNQ